MKRGNWIKRLRVETGGRRATPGYRTLTPGQVVELTVCSTPKGPHARRVVPR